MTILVTGATGQLGAKVVETVLKSVPAEQLAVSVRNPEKASRLREQGVDVRRGDFNDPASLDAAFAGVDRLLIISTDGDNETRISQHLTAVQAAERAGVGLIVYTSAAKASESSLSLAAVHRATEEAIRATGIPYTFLRNNWYIENELSTVQAVLAGAPVFTSAGRGKTGWAPRDDYAQAAAAVLVGSGHENKVYELSGPLASYDEFAATLAEVLGRDVPVEHVDDATYGQIMLGAGVPGFIVPMLVDIQSSIRQGALEVVSDDFQMLLGRPVTPLKQALAQLVKQAGGNA